MLLTHRVRNCVCWTTRTLLLFQLGSFDFQFKSPFIKLIFFEWSKRKQMSPTLLCNRNGVSAILTKSSSQMFIFGLFCWVTMLSTSVSTALSALQWVPFLLILNAFCSTTANGKNKMVFCLLVVALTLSTFFFLHLSSLILVLIVGWVNLYQSFESSISLEKASLIWWWSCKTGFVSLSCRGGWYFCIMGLFWGWGWMGGCMTREEAEREILIRISLILNSNSPTCDFGQLSQVFKVSKHKQNSWESGKKFGLGG